jgi:CheY-like chemotaxis protein
MSDAPRPARVLIVEDEQIVALDLCESLRGLGYDVVGTTGSAEQGVDLACTLAPDIVLMDVRLQGAMDGITAATLIGRGGGPPVVFVTALDDSLTLVRAKFTEPYGFLLKPFNVRELRVTIEMALFHHRMQREREELTRRLRETLEEVTQLRQLLHMCAYCRRVEGDDGHWQSFEAFLKQRTGTSVSHGVCPDCAATLLRDEPDTD